MHFYLQFLFCLILGLVGLCSALKILFDTLLKDWDPIRDIHENIDPSRRRRSFVADWQLGRGLPEQDGTLVALDEAGEA